MNKKLTNSICSAVLLASLGCSQEMTVNSEKQKPQLIREIVQYEGGLEIFRDQISENANIEVYDGGRLLCYADQGRALVENRDTTCVSGTYIIKPLKR